MDLSTIDDESSDGQIVHKPEEIDWQMLDKTKFFFLGAGLFSCVSATLYPVVVLKTKQQVSLSHLSSLKTAFSIISQRLMVQGKSCNKYINGIDAFRKIMHTDGPRGLYRGFGISVMTYAPSNAVWWASYSVTQRLVWGGIGTYMSKKDEDSNENGNVVAIRPDSRTVMAVQGVSAAMAGGVSALVTMPLDTIKTRLQVIDNSSDDNNGRKGPTVGQTVRNLVKEGGLMAFYRGLGPRWASMSMSAATMITTYELLKRLSTKNQEHLVP
ncbi:Mitochondrial carrier domain-containing protein [Artemisia annua]|uniref:Mitochondrial carrier domain-containing protein n=1 Tax=Artemisia annua TaxID=35608 RepID=A0A2U1QHR0_ARTAN|nr:Mitochondrial carrier domain-containing protein [Artemisia annua]